jgi:uncharacterized protein (DUF924 family)
MTPDNLENLSVNALVDRFATIGVEQYKAKDAEQDERYKELFYKMYDIQEELKRRQGDERRALIVLFDYPNMQVRLMAAQYALAGAPQAARRAIEAIAASTWAPQCYDARMCLHMLDEGTFVPN